jgi:hypothetical protein
MARDIQVLGFNYTKLSAERYPDFKGKLEINPNINIASIEKHELNLIKQDAVKIVFSFGIKYKDLADINLQGDIILRTDAKTQKEIIKGWKDKNLDQEIQTMILNLIMQKASIRAIELEEEMGLPIHIKIPRLEVSKKE